MKKIDKNLLKLAEQTDILGALQYYFHTENYEGSFEEYATEQLEYFLNSIQKSIYENLY